MSGALVLTPLHSAVSHLELLGYRAESDTAGTTLKHDTRPLMRLYAQGDRVIFLVPFSVGSHGLADRTGLVEFLNRVNVQTILCKFFFNAQLQVMFVESHYAGPYDKAAFGSFVDAFLQQIWAPRELFPEDVKKFLA